MQEFTITREERREYNREWRKRNRDKLRGYYIARKTERNAYQRAWAKRNPDKVYAAQQRWRRDNPDRVKEAVAKSRANKSDARKLLDRAITRAHRFGLTLNEYLDLLIAQDFCCAVCTKPPFDGHGSRRSLDGFVVDHDHDTNKVRGLLHPNCNVAIGLLQDSVDNAHGAWKYLRKHKT